MNVAYRDPASSLPPATVGIVTALTEEYDAVKVMFGGMTPYPVPGDPTAYATGYVPSRDPDRSHLVVATVLPEGGNDIAATVCTNLSRSFPSMKCVLFAGIAAGIPNLERPGQHVRLGDVVVPWAIIDYDHVDVRPEGTQVRPGFPEPSPRMTAAVNRLLAHDRAGQHPWEPWLDTTRRPELARFRRPDDRTDVLYASDESGRVLKHPRRKDSGHRRGVPKVHRGNIGSADRSLRDASVRDELARRHDLRAVEMEIKGLGRAGFLNGLEWYVVRGISDYGDSRTTPLWRNYASLAAAAFTLALLGECDPFDSGHGRDARWATTGGCP
ncbi:5'-methylthioadenosine/S-adenosylhomocysteine nucleosidase family protein [Actinoallomurus bryophytorum]|uniref:5'-methylthioadenosine/S-adenosylhomocysteine nucleosidase family protein n=1 Tax=Actinoallomurus bryophytorum TaxID=1490222 RepID=UPI00163B19BA|nr:hypothetical protein [Actinoallomurus bryophytorum]